MKFISTFSSTLIFFIVSFNTMAQKEPTSKELEPLYRMYILSRCIYLGFDRDKVFDKDISFSVLNDITQYVTLNSHGRQLDSLVRLKLQSIPQSTIEEYEKKRAIILESILYCDSQELKKQVKEILKSPKKAI
ncbi:MAG: hypothetical protein H7223_12255 [Pedobacter sp.]|nr:hypothetical protein [Pedobacter sp.]